MIVGYSKHELGTIITLYTPLLSHPPQKGRCEITPLSPHNGNLSTTVTFDYSFTSILFLDVNVSPHDGKIVTDPYTKPTDKHQ